MTDRCSRRVLYQLARTVLAEYDLHPLGLRLLSTTEQAVFRVDTASPAGHAERFTLRIYPSAAFDAASLHTEVEWLQALVRDARLLVPEPVLARNGSAIVVSPPGRSTAPYASVAFRWVPGQRRKASMSLHAMEQVGQFTARLHRHAEHFRPSVGTTAQHWNWERVFGGTSIVGPNGSSALLSREQQRLFGALAGTVRQVMQDLGQASTVWGLIHADLHTSNYLFQRDTVGAIDFEDCGWGYYLYDLAVILDEVYAAYGGRAAVLRAALLQGYRQVRPLPDEQLRYLDVFIAMRLAELVRWYGTSANEAHHTSAKQVITEAVTFIHQHSVGAGE